MMFPANNGSVAQAPIKTETPHIVNSVEAKSVKEKQTTKRGLFIEDVKTIAKNGFKNVLLPGVYQTIYNTIVNTAQGVLLGKSPNQTIQSQIQTSLFQPTVNYAGMYGQQLMNSVGQQLFTTQDRRIIPNITIADYAAAMSVVSNLCGLIQTQGKAYMANVKEQIRGLPVDEVDWIFGWTSTDGIGLETVPGGYRIVCPPAVQINTINR